MPIVKLFGNLRRVAGATQLDVPGDTVRAVLDALCAGNANLCAAIRDEAGLRPHVRVIVDGHDVELAQGLDTPLASDAQVAIFPPIAGGAPLP